MVKDLAGFSHQDFLSKHIQRLLQKPDQNPNSSLPPDILNIVGMSHFCCLDKGRIHQKDKEGKKNGVRFNEELYMGCTKNDLFNLHQLLYEESSIQGREG